MRRKRRARSVFTILSLVMAVTVMLGSFMAFADESSDWRERNRDNGPVSHEINLLDKSDQEIDTRVLRDQGQTPQQAPQTPIGISGVHQIGFSAPPLGYSMTITYDWFGEQAPLGVSSIGPNGGTAPSLGFSVIVEDGDLVPDNAALNIAVDADVSAGASPLFKVLVNDAELVDEETDEPLEFRAGHKVTEDTVIAVEPEQLMITPRIWDGGQTITVDGNSETLTSWVYTGNYHNTSGTNYTYYFICAHCNYSGGYTGLFNQGDVGASPTVQPLCGLRASRSFTSWQGSNPAAPTTALHKNLVCEINQWDNATISHNTLNIKFGSNTGLAAASGSTATLLTSLGSVTNTPTTLNFIGDAANVLPAYGRQPHAPIDMTTAIGLASTNVKFDNVDVSVVGTPVAVNGKTVTFDNMLTTTSPAFTATGVISNAGEIRVGTGGKLSGNGVKLAGNEVSVWGTGEINHQNIQNAGAINVGVSTKGGTGGKISGSVSGSGLIDMDSGEISGNVSSSSNFDMDGGIVSGTVSASSADIDDTVGTATISGTVVATTGAIVVHPSVVLSSGTLRAWVDDVSLPAVGGTLARIDAKTVQIPSGCTTKIGVVSLVNGAGSPGSTISGAEIKVLYAGGDVLVDQNALITEKAYAGVEGTINASYPQPALTVNPHLTLDGITKDGTDGIPEVFGGGRIAVASGCDTEITVKNSTIVDQLYLGSDYAGAHVNTATLNHDDATTGEIYGGSKSGASADVDKAIINMNDGLIDDTTFTGHIHGGSAGPGKILTDTTIYLNGGIVNGDVYGGGAGGGGVKKSVVEYTTGSVTEINGPLGIHGAGSSSSNTVEDANVTITEPISNVELTAGYIYGGGSAGHANKTTVTITGTVDDLDVYGGSSAGGMVNGTGSGNKAWVKINGAVTGGDVYGGSGGGNDGTGTGSGNVSATDGTDVDITAQVTGNVYGGNRNGGTVAKTNINNGSTVTETIYGGHLRNGTISGGVIIDNSAGTVQKGIYGGAANGAFAVSAGGVVIDTGDITSGGVHGGGENITGSSSITGGIKINTASSDTINGTGSGIWGGSKQGTLTVTGATVNPSGKSIEINNAGSLTGNIHGGNEAGAFTAGSGVRINNNATITTGAIYGGSQAGNFNVNAGGVTIRNAAVTVPQGIYGGNATGTNTVSITGAVDIQNLGTVSANGIHGGSKSSGSTTAVSGVTIDNRGAVTGGIYGGNEGPSTSTFTTNGTAGVNIDNISTVSAGIYGGSESATTDDIAGVVDIDNTPSGSITANGIHGGSKNVPTTIVGSVNINNTATIGGTGGIYGGNEGPANSSFTTDTAGVIITNNSTAAVPEGIYGGSESGATVSIAGAVNIDNDSTITANGIHGGGKTITTSTSADSVTIDNSGTLTADGIFGGNESGGSFSTTNTTAGSGVNITNSSSAPSGIYGGSEAGTTDAIDGGVRITNSGAAGSVSGKGGIHGGGKTLTGLTTIANGVNIQNTGAGTVAIPGIYGGTESTTATGNNTITGGVQITNSSTATPSVTGGIFGGTESGNFTISGTGAIYGVLINNSGAVSTDGIYGGSKYDSPATQTTTINNGVHIINSGDVESDIYGGAFNGQSVIGDYNGTPGTGTYIQMNGGSVTDTGGTGSGSIYGGNAPNATGAVSSTNVDVYNGATVENDVYGGGNSGFNTPGNSVTGQAEVTVRDGITITFGTVFGGGKDVSPTGSTRVHVGDANIGGRILLGNNAYGGGENSTIAGDTFIEVYPNGGQNTLDNVFGGGTTTNGSWGNASVGGNTRVLIHKSDAIIYNSVYGGGEGNKVNEITGGAGTATVDMENGAVLENIYGGGIKSTAENTFVNVSGGTVGSATTPGLSNVHGGGTNENGFNTNGGLTGLGNNAEILVDTHVTITGGTIGVTSTTDNNSSVYGGGENSPVQGTATVLMSNGRVTNDVFGGGYNGNGDINNTATIANATTVTITSTGHVTGSVYGGGHHGGDVTIGSTLVEISGTARVEDDVFGGGYNNAHILNGNTKIHIKDSADVGTATYGATPVDVVAGGGTGNLLFAQVNGSTEVLLEDSGLVRGSIYGGGYNELNVTPCVVTGNTLITVNGAGARVQDSIYGGGFNNGSDVNGTVGTEIEILKGTVEHNVFGGGNNNAKIATGSTHIVIDDARVGTLAPSNAANLPNLARMDDVIFGGGTGTPGSTVKEKTHIEIGKPNSATINADVHGGGDGTGNDILGVDGAQIDINAGLVTGNVFGGGHDSGVQKTVINHYAKVDGTMWGGGVSRTTDNANVTTGGVKILIDGGEVTGNVSGGGVSTAGFTANVTSNTEPHIDMDIIGGGKVTGSVFGGGEGQSTATADINGDVDILVENSTIETDLWGGGHHGGAAHYVNGASNYATVHGNVNMKLDGATIGTTGTTTAGNVYGGGQDNAVIGVVDQIHTTGATTVHGSLYGGGHGTGKGDEANATIHQQGTAVTSSVEDVVVTILMDGQTHVVGNVYGGGHYGHVYGSIKLDAVAKNFDQNIYGGGRNGDVEWNDFVHVYGTADVGDSVYGGGIMDDPATVPPSNIYTVGGYTDVIIDGHIHGNVYGGGHRIDVLNNGNHADKGATVHIKENAKIGDDPMVVTDERGTVYGGGRDANISNANHGGTWVYLAGDANVYWDVYGGGWNETTESYRPTAVPSVAGNEGNVAGPEGTYVELKERSHVHHNVYGGGRNHGDILHPNAGTVVELMDFSVIGNDRKEGDVFGGGNYGHVLGAAGTKVTLHQDAWAHGTIYGGSYFANVDHGTDVIIYGQVGDTYHTRTYIEPVANDPRPSFYDGTDQDCYGVDRAKTGNVYGGGHHGHVLGSEGTQLLVSDIESGYQDKAVIWNSTYGGGFEGYVQHDTVVTITESAQVYNSVFGGGQQSKTNPYLGNPLAAEIRGTTTVNITNLNTRIGHPDIAKLRENSTLVGNRANDSNPQWIHNNDLELHAGRIFGGGDFAVVQSTATVNVDQLEQIALRTVSGGSFGVNSVNTDRIVNLNQLGTGEGEANPYDDLTVYTVIKHLADYTVSNVTDCYLTVFYHLRSTDDNTDNGIEYPGYPGYPGGSGDYRSEYRSVGGKYHPWRPYPHKDIIVDPIFSPFNTMFRMEGGYTIDMRPGGLENAAPTPTELLIDRSDRSWTVTSKIYGPNNNIMDPTAFGYNHLPVTLSPKNLIDRMSNDIVGINFYIPPTHINIINGETTNHGGTDILDETTGNTGAPEYEATDRTVSVKANEKDLIKKVQDAVKKTAKGKTAYVSESRYDQVSPEILTNVNKAAVAAGGKTVLMFDTMNGNSVQGRMYLDPSRKLPEKTINTRVYTVPARISQAKVNFENYYGNNFAFVQLGHTGSFGIEVEIAAKVNLDKLNTKNLIFYAYSESANSYKRIENPRYFIDNNGYLHFHTAVGGTVIVTDKPLARK